MAKAKPKAAAAARAGRTRQVMFSLEDEDLELLDYLCGRVAARQGGNPDRMRSPLVRALIRGEAAREKLRESQEPKPLS